MSMRQLTIEEWESEAADFEASVLRTDEISPFCSGVVWQTAARNSLHGIEKTARNHIFEREGNWIVFVEREQRDIWFPFESAWMFGCPLIGNPEECVALLEESFQKSGTNVAGFCIGGVRQNGALHQALESKASSLRDYREFPAMESMVIDLGEGSQAWLERRTKKFRRSLRSSLKNQEIEIYDASEDDPTESFQRILAIQNKTYKWEEGTDILQSPEYRRFYRDMILQLTERGELQLLIARMEGQDVAYIFGGFFERTYRGLQMSYSESVRSLGVGNRLQWENLQRCEARGVDRYDLGMYADYKARWADRREDYVAIFLVFDKSLGSLGA